MTIKEEVQKAMGAHGLWKVRLKDAINTGKSEFTATTVCQDNQCAFGQWLYGLNPSVKNLKRWQCVKQAHADFHREAGRVLELALAGKKDAANAIMTGPTSSFEKASTKLVMELVSWKNESE